MFITYVSFSQYTIKGSVTDISEPVSYANVVLLNTARNIMAGAITDENDNF